MGYWLVKGDKTTCGGHILEGTDQQQFGGHYAAMNGFRVSCGKHKGQYRIDGGYPGDMMNGNTFASTLYSRSTCPCKARFIPSQTFALHGPYQDDSPEVSPSALAPADDPVQHAQSARKNSTPTRKEKREITLTLGVFFDGTGNNAVNINNMLQACTAGHYHLSNPEAEGIFIKCAQDKSGISGLGATSYTGYYTNIHWLSTLYQSTTDTDSLDIQQGIYIDGIGTEAGKPDSITGQVFGKSDTGVVAKTNKAVSAIAEHIKAVLFELRQNHPEYEIVIKSLQFDIFGFSRGAAASRHFANRIQSEDPTIIRAIREGISGTTFNGAAAGKIRFIGLLDTVAAIGAPANGQNPRKSNTGDVNLMLRPGVAEKVFHITAAHECRFNFALSSVKPGWPELALPGAHADIGGGYLPVVTEKLFLTRPKTDTVPLSLPGQQTRGYHQAAKQLAVLDSCPCIAPIMRTSEISAESWYDDRMPPDRYGSPQKRSFAALTLHNRIVKNDWSKVVLRVMLDAAQEAGVLFDPISVKDKELDLPDELAPLCEKALAMGKAARSGQPIAIFSEDELDRIAGEYIHCSANWNAIIVDSDGFITGGAAPSQMIGFVDRPDKKWQRTVYNMDGNKL